MMYLDEDDRENKNKARACRDAGPTHLQPAQHEALRRLSAACAGGGQVQGALFTLPFTGNPSPTGRPERREDTAAGRLVRSRPLR